MACIIIIMLQVMSESVASALQYLDNDKTQQTWLFIRMVDRFFDCLNVRNPLLAQMKRKDSIAPYKSQNDERFKVQHMHMQSILHPTLTVNIIIILFIVVERRFSRLFT